jgi:hypothetical protein
MRLTWFLAATASLLLYAPIALSTSNWESVGTHEGMELFRKEIPGSNVLAYRGVGILEVRLERLLSIITDTPRKPEWMNRIQSARVLRVSGPRESIEYIHVNCPWPVTDRDFVYRTWVEIVKEQRKVIVHFESINDLLKPAMQGMVRAIVHFGTFTLTPEDGGRRTRVEAVTHTDPMGAIPKWIVNLYQRKWAQEALEGLLKQAAKPNVQDSPLISDLPAPSYGSN